MCLRGSGVQRTQYVHGVTYVCNVIDMCLHVDLTQAMWDDVTWVGKAAINISALLNGRLKVPQISVDTRLECCRSNMSATAIAVPRAPSGAALTRRGAPGARLPCRASAAAESPCAFGRVTSLTTQRFK